jgi:hypothetical protein
VESLHITVADMEAMINRFPVDQVVELQISAGHHILWRAALWWQVEAAEVTASSSPGEGTVGILRALLDRPVRVYIRRVVEARPLREEVVRVLWQLSVLAQVSAITEVVVEEGTMEEALAIVLEEEEALAMQMAPIFPPGQG